MATVANFRWFFLPYCIVFNKDGSYIFLNRAYKPLGQLSDDWVDYETHSSVLRDRRLTPKKVIRMGLHSSGCIDKQPESDATADTFYFYNDGCVPTHSKTHWDRYQKLLEKIANVRVTAP